MGIETAPYTVTNSWEKGTIELRHYDSLLWICTANSCNSMDKAKSECFWKLFKYIGGKNAENVKVPMTAPVTIESIPDNESAMQRRFVMGFYIPEAFKSNPPSPTDNQVFIERRPSMDVYCLTYDGFSNNDKVFKNARKLGETLDQLGLKYTPDPFYFAGYDSPFKFIHRRNEIWFKAD
uniref:Heme-binding protein 1 n=1 Tax=Trichobilharzia regenti TaxID=157069 RepID=A0AA85J4Z4_TRIRE|nr:unnamed protein product [Trichobilharzia regenti]